MLEELLLMELPKLPNIPNQNYDHLEQLVEQKDNTEVKKAGITRIKTYTKLMTIFLMNHCLYYLQEQYLRDELSTKTTNIADGITNN